MDLKYKTALRLILISFVIPCIMMSSFYAFTETRPPKISIPVLDRIIKLTPVWHNLSTAYRNQHRLVLAGFPVAVLLALYSMALETEGYSRKKIWSFFMSSTALVAFAANGLDCLWHFRLSQEIILSQTLLRSIPWIAAGAISLWIMNSHLCFSGKEKA